MTSGRTDLRRLAEQVFGSTELARTWLDTPSPFLDGRSPRSALGTAEGREQVRALLLRIEHGLLA